MVGVAFEDKCVWIGFDLSSLASDKRDPYVALTDIRASQGNSKEPAPRSGSYRAKEVMESCQKIVDARFEDTQIYLGNIETRPHFHSPS